MAEQPPAHQAFAGASGEDSVAHTLCTNCTNCLTASLATTLPGTANINANNNDDDDGIPLVDIIDHVVADMAKDDDNDDDGDDVDNNDEDPGLVERRREYMEHVSTHGANRFICHGCVDSAYLGENFICTPIGASRGAPDECTHCDENNMMCRAIPNEYRGLAASIVDEFAAARFLPHASMTLAPVLRWHDLKRRLQALEGRPHIEFCLLGPETTMVQRMMRVQSVAERIALYEGISLEDLPRPSSTNQTTDLTVARLARIEVLLDRIASNKQIPCLPSQVPEHVHDMTRINMRRIIWPSTSRCSASGTVQGPGVVG
ncbi:hypothetical protein QBC39DRAFT_385403 [Podospora conica]|nr:hypothetical protein QBC39DRAFT_385403 [Schizothecium conicum]